MNKEKYKEQERELCSHCGHTKRFHKKGCCSQPTCGCNCFIESGLIYTTDIFNAFRQGKEKAKYEFYKKLEELKEIMYYLPNDENTKLAHKFIEQVFDEIFKSKEQIEYENGEVEDYR